MLAGKTIRKHVSLRLPLLLAMLVAGCARGAAPPADPVEARLLTLDVRERAAQTLAPLLETGEDGLIQEGFRAQIATGAAGALLLREGDSARLARAVSELRTAAPFPLLVLLDSDALPPVPELAELAEPALVRQAGELAAHRARGVGADLVLVPLPPLNGAYPLPATSREPQRVADGIIAFAEGASSGGVGVAVRALWSPDSVVQPLRWDRARLEALELPLLAGALGGAVRAVQLGPIQLPALTGGTLPLPVSPAVTRGLLRRDLGFDGLVMADLSPGSPLLRGRDPASVAVEAVAAGVDLLLGVERPAAIVDAMAAAVTAGQLSPERLEDAARRVLRLQHSAAGARDGSGVPADSAAPRPARFDTLPLLPLARALAAAAPPVADSILLFARAGEGEEAPPVRWPPAPLLRELPPDSVDMRPAFRTAIDRLMRKGLADSVFTGAAIAVGRRGGLVLLRGYGREGRQGEGEPVDPRRTIFDLASLTKVIGTTTAVALLVDEGKMELDAPLEQYLPRFDGGEKDEVLIRHLLTHTSGLPSGLWLFGSARSAEEALQQVLDQELLREPGKRMEYSDLGMILLEQAAERAAGMPLDRYLAGHVFAPLGMESTMYLPPAAFRLHVVPTAEKTEREFPLLGVVHDANAFRLGGVAGHAGLFSTAADLAVFAQMMLNGGSYGTVPVLSARTVEAFTRRQPGAEQRALGWDTPSPVSSAGDYFSARAYGHTGYTGTSLWVDPASGLFVVLLTNRTYPGASGGDILRLRAAVHDAAARALTDRPVRKRPGAR